MFGKVGVSYDDDLVRTPNFVPTGMFPLNKSTEFKSNRHTSCDRGEVGDR